VVDPVAAGVRSKDAEMMSRGEDMKRKIAAMLSVIVLGLMLAPNVCAAKSVVRTVSDTQGDVGKYNVYLVVGSANGVSSPEPSWGGEAWMLDVKYVDMVSTWFGKVGDNFVFGMQLAGDLPKPGDPLPQGLYYVGWQVWIEHSPWTTTSGSTTLFQVYLQYNDSKYCAGLMDAKDWSDVPLQSFTISGDRFQIEVPSAMLGDLKSCWWTAGVYVAKQYIWAWPWFTDLCDFNVAPDEVVTDFPWPH
jgi:hypothetical protein